MPNIFFETDWVDPEGVNGPELAATWANLTIRAGEHVLTRVLDQRVKTVRDYVRVPLYPLAEWLVTNWWFLTNEFENPIKKSDLDFHRRHSLGANREGYAYPSLEVIPSGSRTRIAWSSAQSNWTKVEFLLKEGELWVASDEFRESCADLINQVIGRLVDRDVAETLLEEEWSAIQEADSEELIFCATSAGLGWDPYDMDDTKSRLVLMLDGKLRNILDEAVPALDPENLEAGCSAISDAIDKAKINGLSMNRLGLFGAEFSTTPNLANPPWETGYSMAQHLRDKLDIANGPLPTIKELADVLGAQPELLEKATLPVGNFAAAQLVDGVVTSQADGIPAFAFRKLDENRRRFHFCRALAEVLVSPGSDALITRAQSERQQRNRAFAAEFLAPSLGLRDRVSRSVVDGDDIAELASEFQVSSTLIEHQITNHGIAQVRQ